MDVVVLKNMLIPVDINALAVGVIDFAVPNGVPAAIHIDASPQKLIPAVVVVDTAAIHRIVSRCQPLLRPAREDNPAASRVINVAADDSVASPRPTVPNGVVVDMPLEISQHPGCRNAGVVIHGGVRESLPRTLPHEDSRVTNIPDGAVLDTVIPAAFHVDADATGCLKGNIPDGHSCCIFDADERRIQGRDLNG